MMNLINKFVSCGKLSNKAFNAKLNKTKIYFLVEN